MAADVVDEAGHSLRNQVGELVIRKPWIGMTRGFWRDRERYLQAYWSRFPDVWVHGDWAAIDQDGLWCILGRSDDTIKVAGKRLGPAEVESALVSHAAVSEAAVIGVPDSIKGQEVVCFCVLKPGRAFSDELREELRDLVAQSLGKPLKPREVKFVRDLPDPFVSVDVAPLPVIQGNTIAITVLTSRDVSLNGTFLDWTIPFAKQGSAYYGLVGVHAMQKVGLFPLTITATDATGKQTSMTTSVQVVAGKFVYELIDLSPEKQALLAPDLVNAERDKLYGILSTFTPTRYWNGLFTVPATGNVTSAFGSRRTYKGGVFANYHEGTDFWGATGMPVYAPADGVVALAGPLAVRGNAILIDHGWGVFSGLYHLSKIEVTAGQRVKQGQLVGRIGSTGLSTGAHLHWDVRVRGLNVDPLQWTRRIFP
jgi:murein DD-endopeptidase MepM/ murein hydrolase activator NlpD